MSSSGLFKRRIDECLKQIVDECAYPAELKEIINYSLFPGGKRLRPVAFCLWHELYAPVTEDAIKLACAIELFHSFSLIHDDMPCLDNDDFRRGKPSVHKKYGEARALLAGDALYGLAHTVIAETCGGDKSNIAWLISELFGSCGVISGQYDDVFGKPKCAEDVLKVYERKTGALIYAACVCGCVYAQAPTLIKELDVYIKNGVLTCLHCDAQKLPEWIRNSVVFGAQFGIAFQLYDDLSEYLAGESADGASVLEYMSFDKSRAMLNEMIGNAICALDSVNGDVAELKELAETFVIE